MLWWWWWWWWATSQKKYGPSFKFIHSFIHFVVVRLDKLHSGIFSFFQIYIGHSFMIMMMIWRKIFSFVLFGQQWYFDQNLWYLKMMKNLQKWWWHKCVCVCVFVLGCLLKRARVKDCQFQNNFRFVMVSERGYGGLSLFSNRKKFIFYHDHHYHCSSEHFLTFGSMVYNFFLENKIPWFENDDDGGK